MITRGGIAIRAAETDADLQAWADVRRAVVPNESTSTVAQLRAEESPDRLLTLVEAGGRIIGSGLADRSQTTGSFIAPRILPEHRRRGHGTELLRHLIDHATSRRFTSVSGHVEDDGSYAFATRHGFEEVDREVEQVRTVAPNEPAAPSFEGVRFSTVASRPELLQRAYALAVQGYADMILRTGPATVSVHEWIRDEATLPGGSFVALERGIIVGYAGLVAWTGDETRAENGLTVVDRGWRGRGLATALKQRQLAWASANGIREIVTWTQLGNEAMQHVNQRLGYTTRSVSRTMRRELPEATP
ncbi:MAG: GNAT family N-acetyltransferase [Chloroflexota bacterium]